MLPPSLGDFFTVIQTSNSFANQIDNLSHIVKMYSKRSGWSTRDPLQHWKQIKSDEIAEILNADAVPLSELGAKVNELLAAIKKEDSI